LAISLKEARPFAMSMFTIVLSFSSNALPRPLLRTDNPSQFYRILFRSLI